MCCGTGWVSNHTGNLQGILWADFQAPLKLSTRTISREHLLQGVFPSNWLPSSQTPQKNGLLLDLFIFGYHLGGVTDQADRTGILSWSAWPSKLQNQTIFT
jgi:hypothetical protein